MTNGRVKARAAKAARRKVALDLVLDWLGDAAVPSEVLDQGKGEDHLRSITRTLAVCKGMSGGRGFVRASWDRLLYSYCAALDIAMEDKVCDPGWAKVELQRLARLSVEGPRAACASFQAVIGEFGGNTAAIYIMGGGRSGAMACLNIASMAGAVARGRLDPDHGMFKYCQAMEIFRVQSVLACLSRCPGLRPCMGSTWLQSPEVFLKEWWSTIPAEWRTSTELLADALSILPFNTLGRRMLAQPRCKPLLVTPDGRMLL